MDKKVVTGKVRGNYMAVFSPKYDENKGKDQYSMMILIPKSDTATINSIKAAEALASKEKWGDKVPKGLKSILRDGDMEEKGEDYVGHYFMNVKSNNRPGIVDANRNDVLNADEFRNGDYCRVSINAYAYDVNGNRGVSFGLNNIQVLGEGVPFSGGRARAQDDFDAVEQEDF